MSNSPHHPACRIRLRDGHVVVLGAGTEYRPAGGDPPRPRRLLRDAPRAWRSSTPAEAEDRFGPRWQRSRHRNPVLSAPPPAAAALPPDDPGRAARDGRGDGGRSACLRFNALRIVSRRRSRSSTARLRTPATSVCDVLTGRRPVDRKQYPTPGSPTSLPGAHGFSSAASSAPARLLVDDDRAVPHVVGVGTSTGKTLRTSLVVGRCRPADHHSVSCSVAPASPVPVEEIDDV